MSLFVRFLIVISSCLILSSSYKFELVLVLIDTRAESVGTWFWIIGLGGGGKASTPKWGICNGAFFRGKLGNKGIMDLGCIFPEYTKVCSIILVVW